MFGRTFFQNTNFRRILVGDEIVNLNIQNSVFIMLYIVIAQVIQAIEIMVISI